MMSPAGRLIGGKSEVDAKKFGKVFSLAVFRWKSRGNGNEFDIWN